MIAIVIVYLVFVGFSLSHPSLYLALEMCVPALRNLLLVDDSNDSNIKLGDFGFAKRLADEPEGLRTRCGTPAFVAPEILLGVPYGSSVDCWSCGGILYLLLGGYPPFQAENSKALFRKIRAADYGECLFIPLLRIFD